MKFFLENWYSILSICFAIGSIIVSLFIKRLEIIEKGKSLIKDLVSGLINSLVIQAEKFSNYSGTEKKLFVVTRLKEFLVSKKVSWFGDDLISDLIENAVDLTKKVNQREKDKEVKE